MPNISNDMNLLIRCRLHLFHVGTDAGGEGSKSLTSECNTPKHYSEKVNPTGLRVSGILGIEGGHAIATCAFQHREPPTWNNRSSIHAALAADRT